MSTIRGRFLKDKCTVWKQGAYDPDNPYTQSWGSPIVLNCNYRDGGEVQRDQDGADFQPISTYRCKNGAVSFGDRVVLGASSATTPPNNAETVKRVVRKTVLRGSADMTFYTG